MVKAGTSKTVAQKRKRQAGDFGPYAGCAGALETAQPTSVLPCRLPRLTHLALSHAAKVLGDVNLVTKVDAQHAILARKLKTVAHAATRLGHRSCHMLWGSRESCKELLLDTTARALKKCDSALVLQLDGAVLQNDDDAIRKVAADVAAFLSSSTSAKLRHKSSAFRNGTVEFLQLMKVTGAVDAAIGGQPSRDDCDENDVLLANRKRQRGDLCVVDAPSDDWSTRPSAVPPPPPARPIRQGTLSALQDCLLSLNKLGVGIVACVNDVARFGVWCDRMMYLISGLMHGTGEDGVGAGMALILTSPTADLRHTEKRLSSRLTCEMWHVAAPASSIADIMSHVMAAVETLLIDNTNAVALQVKEIDTLLRSLARKAVPPAAGRQSRVGTAPTDDGSLRDARAAKVMLQQEQARTSDALLSVRAMRAACATLTPKSVVVFDTGVLGAASTCLSDMWRTSLLPYLASRAHPWHEVLAACRQLLAASCFIHNEGNHDTQQGTSCVLASAVLARGGLDADVLEGGALVRLGYASREVMLLLAFATMRAENSVRRTLEQLVHDVGSSMGTVASMKSVVASNYRWALAHLCRLGILGYDDRDEHSVVVKRSIVSCKQFLRDVLTSPTLWEDAGLTMQDKHLLLPMVS